MAIGQLSKHLAFAFLPRGYVFANTLLLFLDDSYGFFATLQSQLHFHWVIRWGGAMRQDVRYTSTDCFETFPFPRDWTGHEGVEAAGRDCYEFRAALMARNNEGLTKTYNRFHDPDEHDAGIVRLRQLHAQMDGAVLGAYGWDEIPTDCEFILEDQNDDEDGGRRRKPFRYRWPDEVRDEVLARLIALNGERAAEEQRSGAAANASAGGRTTRSGRAPRKSQAHAGEALF